MAAPNAYGSILKSRTDLPKNQLRTSFSADAP